MTEAIAFSGTLDEVQDHFESLGWTDGLPIVPPTPERVAAFLAQTSRSPDQTCGKLPPSNNEATVLAVAVNGVMAGCRPEYMPILITIVEILATPLFRLEDAGSTPGWEPLVIVSGPVVERLGFNSGTGALKAGYRPNTTIGRFTRLCMRNIAGFRVTPDITDKGTFGLNFFVALAENHTAIDQLGWPSVSEDRGFDRDDDVVTVQSVLALTGPMYASSGSGEEILDHIGRVLGLGLAPPWLIHGLIRRHWHPLLLLSPLVAQRLADEGFDKPAIRDYLHQTVRIAARELERCHGGSIHGALFGALDPHEESLLAEFIPGFKELREHGGGLPEDCYVPTFPWADQIGIVVTGDPLRNQSRGFINNHNQGVPVSRKVDWPDSSANAGSR